MQTYLDCIPCIIRQSLDALRQITDDEELMHRALRRVLAAASEFEMELSPPAMGQILHRIIREESGDPDPYAEIKARSNAAALRMLEEARPLVEGASDPFEMAVRFSIAGNIMDFALVARWNAADFSSLVEQTRKQVLDKASLEAFRQAVREAKTILVLGDNAGEIVFDRLLLEQMGHAKIIYAVKGAPAVNDVLREDALAAGIDQLAEIIDNGSDAPGTLLDQCSASFREHFKMADLVIAKGQGNYESLSDVSRSVFFLARVKCAAVGNDLGKPVGSWVVQHHRGGGHV